MDRFFKANAVLSVFSKNYMDLKQDLPIRPSEMGVLNIITQMSGPHTSAMLAELLSVSKPMITAHINSLEDKGYITKVQSSKDKRAFYINPTDKALELVERAKADLNSKLSNLQEALGREAFDSLVELAERANAIMKKGRI